MSDPTHDPTVPRTIFVPCEYCQREGRILRQGRNVWDEVDCGPCPECHGTGVIEVETQVAADPADDEDATDDRRDDDWPAPDEEYLCYLDWRRQHDQAGREWDNRS